MKRLWLLFILFLTTVSTAHNKPGLEVLSLITVEELKPEPKRVYYPLYEEGFVIDSSTLVFLDDVKITEVMYGKLMVMVNAALKDSISIHINSAYRTFEEQLECRINNVKRKSKRYDSAYLLHSESKHFRPITAKPGYSAHQKGVAFDFDTTDQAVYAWLKANALSYGFVRTVKSERWHWEYRPEVTDMYQFIKQNHRSWR
jgi:D-alanyl-D-alanine carboxypeptidase